MPGSQSPNDGLQTLRIAPNLDLEKTKLIPTDADGTVAGRRDAAGNRSAGGSGGSPSRPAQRVKLLQFEPPPEPKGHRALWFLAAAAAAFIVGILINEFQQGVEPTEWEIAERSGNREFIPVKSSPDGRFDPVRERTQRKIDSQGRTTRVLGDDPLGVLRAYCAAADEGETRLPIGLSESLPRRPDTRMGLFENAVGETRAIRIRLRPGGKRWFAGDGRSPVPSEIPPVSITRR